MPWGTLLVLLFLGSQTVPAHAGHVAEFTKCCTAGIKLEKLELAVH